MTPKDSDKARDILLVAGASNVALSARILAEVAVEVEPPFTDLVLIGGHGRSLARSTRVLGRGLPSLGGGAAESILERIWSPESRVSSIMTDFGNDLVYGLSAERLLAFASRTLDRFERFRPSPVVLALPPMKRIRELGAPGIQAAMAVLFPKHRPDPDCLMEQSLALSEGLYRLCDSRGAVCLEPSRDWYSIDPIHIRRSARRRAWREMIGVVRQGGPAEPAPLRLAAATLPARDRFALLASRPAGWSWMGMRLGEPRQSTVVVAKCRDGRQAPALTVWKG